MTAQVSREHIRSLLQERSNWGRWGTDDENGAMNLVTQSKIAQAMSLVRSGDCLSLSMPWSKFPSSANPFPAQHFMKTRDKGHGAGSVSDYLGIRYHGIVSTHIDALCHVWDANGMWNGRLPTDVITYEGVRWGAIDQWRNGVVTRGVLLDIPQFRNTPYVALDEPVHAHELADVAASQGVSVEPGDALVVYSGRDRWEAENGPYGGGDKVAETANFEAVPRPGLHASCLEYLRDTDCSVLIWDMMDCVPSGYEDLPWGVHAAVFAYGIALVDSALLGPLSAYCRENGRYEFAVVVAPLNIAGGTGSPVNPLALF